MVFVRRKLDSGPKTLGEKLRDLRRGQAVTLEMMEKKTHIQRKYLTALERGRYADLPEPLYTRNFIRAYTRALHADESYFIELYEDEVGVCDLVAHMQTPRQRLKRKALFVWNHAFRFVMLGVVVLGLGIYLSFQLTAIVSPPDVVVITPVNESVAGESTVVVEGLAEKEATVYVNGDQVVVNSDLTFSTTINLKRGVNTIVIESERKYSRKSVETRTIIFDPDVQSASL